MPSPGDVLRMWDRLTTPPKVKLHICICPTRQLLLRINTLCRFPPCHPLAVAQHPFLRHDSFVELTQMQRHLSYEIAQADIIGKLSQRSAAHLIAASDAAPTLTADQKRLIRERLAEI